ncbi:MAG: CbtB domain-containing protein [Acidiferrobacterales bacterium]
MHIETASTVPANVVPASVSASVVLPALFVAFLGLALVYAAGFSKIHVLHNAAHDARHSAGFPCH